ncbi:MAG: PD-(D/E)XK nuclease family protein, partial [Bifidobacteriaceae bacterium]|nr:PD-(D/E)XK nuclease family protein [Bifidobacteriaceae bacterium]
ERLAALDALETVMKPVKADEATGISPDGLARLRRIGRVLRRLRLAASYLSLPELVLEAERALGLDLDLLSGPSGREQVNQLVNEAHAYARGQDQVGVASFLAWLEAEGEQFDGLDLAEAPTAGRAVQLLTVHSAKGLEWDVVCVPGLVDASFPAVTMAETDHGREPLAVAWLSDANRAGSSGGLPWPLRLDKEALESFDHPAFDPSGLSGADCDGPGAVGPSENSPDAAREGADEGVDLGDVVALGESFNDFKRRAGAYFEREERRVAYVAATRAKSHLLLTGSWYAAGRASGRPPSIFLEELAEAGLISRDHWVADPGLNESEAGPAGTWPPEHPAGRREPVLVAAARAVERRAAKLGRLKPAQAAALLEQMDSDLARRAALLIRESAESAAPKTVRLPAQTSATTLVALTGQPAEALRRLRRPSPIAPSRGSAVGEAFHRRAAVELAAQSDGPARQAMLDSAVLADVRADSATEAQLNSLMERFRQSRWMSGGDSLVAVETELEVELLGRAVVARIDAVFRDRAGRTVVVDWKTGRSDHGRAHPAHYEQVRLYQAACAKQDGVSPAQIGGYVHYIMENLSVPVECPPDHLERLSDRLAATSAAET